MFKDSSSVNTRNCVCRIQVNNSLSSLSIIVRHFCNIYIIAKSFKTLFTSAFFQEHHGYFDALSFLLHLPTIRKKAKATTQQTRTRSFYQRPEKKADDEFCWPKNKSSLKKRPKNQVDNMRFDGHQKLARWHLKRVVVPRWANMKAPN